MTMMMLQMAAWGGMSRGRKNDDVETNDVEQEEGGEVAYDDVVEGDRSQNRDPHSMRM